MWQRLAAARLGIWVLFLIAVPIAVLLAGQSKWAIIGSAAGAYALVLVAEVAVVPRGQEATMALIRRRKRTSEAKPKREVEREPQPEREPDAEPVAETVVPQPQPEPEPEPVVLAAVPDPEPEPEPEREPEPGPPVVVSLPVAQEPRRWNVWDLERLKRASAGVDAAQDDERTYLLLYLREYADPNGLLPLDFDGLVRESFGDLVATL
jgi:outer membrane biosynthesis protein TonB